MYTITVKFEGAKAPVLLERIRAGDSLLEVCLQHGIELRHECGGMCSCTTCHLLIQKGSKFIEEMSKREKDILVTKNKIAGNSRLGCQCLLLEGEGEIEVRIPSFY